ncbi:MAG: hypothetical protein HOP19_25090 [Acidobacteria bacterium]|nr:hypothetical protein [Acidobacteriota bacterium]
MNKTMNSHYEFGRFQLNLTQQTLWCGAEEITLTPKLFETLRLLVERHGEILERQELMQAIWGDTYVEEGNLSTMIYTLRKMLGGEQDGTVYIATVPRRGYRFIAPVVQVGTMPKPMRETVTINSLAVLPFKPLGPLGMEAGAAGLGLGLMDALITRLSNIRSFSVRPTSAVRKYHGWESDPVLAGRELETEAVLEGNFQWADGRGRVTVQLLSVGTGAPLWAQPFDEPFTDVFSFEDAISQRVADALTRTLQVIPISPTRLRWADAALC